MNNDLNTMKTNYGMGFTIQSIIEENAELLKVNPINNTGEAILYTFDRQLLMHSYADLRMNQFD